MLKIGDKVSVTSDKKKVRVGTVYYENDFFYTIQFPKYKECFLKVDVRNGAVKINVLQQ